MRYTTIVALLVSLALAPACRKVVVRDAGTFIAEHAAAVARQKEAAQALYVAAERAAEAGDREACALYAEPALLIEAAAEHQANRSLYLAGLLDDDPGPVPDPAPVASVCGEEN